MKVKLNKKDTDIEREKGTNVELVLHVMRHGDRNLNGTLEEYGREKTKESAKTSHLANEEFGAVKAFGSTAGPKNKSGRRKFGNAAFIGNCTYFW